MKLKNILGLLLMVAAFSAAASAQLPSLANVGDDMYTSEEDGFEIAVPDGCMKMSSSANGRSYTCELKEGRIVVNVDSGSTEIKTDKDVADFLTGFKTSLSRDPGIKLLGESPAKIGDYRGAAYQLTLDGDKTIMVAVVWGKFAVTILGRANGKVAGSSELITAAVQSFAFNSDDN